MKIEIKKQKDKNQIIKNKMKKWVDGDFVLYLVMVLPLFIIYMVLAVIPTFSTLALSFTNFNGVSLAKFDWVGIRNYDVAFQDEVFWISLKNTLIYAVFVTLVQNFLGLLVALGLNVNMKTKNFQRTLIFAPAIISTVVASYVWTYIYDTNGLLNSFLQMIGLEQWMHTWLGEPKFALLGVAISNIWRFIGYSAVIFIANLQSIPKDVLEAADIDGASGLNKFKYVIFPLLAPSTTINITLSFIGCLKVFDTIFTMTQGGPGHYTEVIGTYIVQLQGRTLNGYASALAVIMTIVILGLNSITFTFLKRREEK